MICAARLKTDALPPAWSVDLGVQGLAYGARLDVDGIELREALQLAPGEIKQHLSGTLFGSCLFDVTGSDLAAFLKNLTARADLRIDDATMNLPGIFPQLAAVIKTPALESVRFGSAGLRLNLRNETVHISGSFTGLDISLYPEGTIGLDGSIDLVANLHVAPGILPGDAEFGGCLEIEKVWLSCLSLFRGPSANPALISALNPRLHHRQGFEPSCAGTLGLNQ